MFPTTAAITTTNSNNHEINCNLKKRINEPKDVIYFKTQSLAYRSIVTYIELLCEKIRGTGNKEFNSKYKLRNEVFQACAMFMDTLEQCCRETDLNLAKSAGTPRFGHVAFRAWHDKMRKLCREFVYEITASRCEINDQFREELIVYLCESFGNRMRIDYGTGHELNFMIFTMGLSGLFDLNEPTEGDVTRDVKQNTDQQELGITPEKLKSYVSLHAWDIHWLFAKSYLKLCRQIQIKFRLEPAGSRGVYNMDDFQFLPFLLGSAQLFGVKHISTSDFYLQDQVDYFKDDFIFFEAVDFILNNKRGPFNEHSYTLWNFTNLGSWDNIHRRIKVKFIDDILNPLPIVQHFLFGDYILKWDAKEANNV